MSYFLTFIAGIGFSALLITIHPFGSIPVRKELVKYDFAHYDTQTGEVTLNKCQKEQ